MTTTREDRERMIGQVTHDDASDAVRIAYADETGSATAGVAFTTAQRYIEQQRAAEASTQALREAAELLIAHWDEFGSSGINHPVDALRSALSPSPAQGGAAVPASFGVGDVVKIVAGPWSNSEAIVDAEGSVDGRVAVATRATHARVYPRLRDLVLVRKATVKP